MTNDFARDFISLPEQNAEAYRITQENISKDPQNAFFYLQHFNSYLANINAMIEHKHWEAENANS